MLCKKNRRRSRSESKNLDVSVEKITNVRSEALEIPRWPANVTGGGVGGTGA